MWKDNLGGVNSVTWPWAWFSLCVPADSSMLASVTEVEVELHVPDDVSTFFGVTWAQDPETHMNQVRRNSHESCCRQQAA